MTTETIIQNLKQFEKNPRTLTEKQFQLLDISLFKFGDLSGIIVQADTKEIIGGNQRIKIMLKKVQEENAEYKIIPTKTFDEPQEDGTVLIGHLVIEDKWFNYREVRWTQEQREQANIQANKLGGTWDWDALANEWETEDLLEWGFEKFEFDMHPIEKEYKGNTDEDVIPETPTESYIKLGDLIELGNHKLLCGNSTNIQDIEKLMNEEKADIIFTSPPYNAGSGDRGGLVSHESFYQNDSNDNKTEKQYRLDNLKLFEIFQKVCVNDFNVFWNLNYNANDRANYIKFIHDQLDQYSLIETLIWLKETALPNQGLARLYEFIFCLTPKRENLFYKSGLLNRKELKGNFSGYNVLKIKNEQEEKSVKHHAQFPIALCEKIFEYDLRSKILEPFGGTGTTLIACEKMNRKCFMMEIESIYCDVIIQRYCDYTGNKSVKINGVEIDWDNK